MNLADPKGKLAEEYVQKNPKNVQVEDCYHMMTNSLI